MDNNAITFQEVRLNFHTEKIRLELWDIITTNGYDLEAGTYKLIPKK